MIISQTPLRISFAGGGTDLSEFWRNEEGHVLLSAVDIYIHVIIKKRFDDLIVLNYTKRETVHHVSEIKHDLVREALKITGAGGGGFLLIYIPRERQDKVRAALKEYRELPFSLEQDGSKIIFNNRR